MQTNSCVSPRALKLQSTHPNGFEPIARNASGNGGPGRGTVYSGGWQWSWHSNTKVSLVRRISRTENIWIGTFSQIDELLSLLPHLTEKQVDRLGHKGANLAYPFHPDSPHNADSMCPICYTSFSAILAEEETALAMDSPAHPIEELGVTILDKPWQCSHIFCRKE